jgi:nitrous oxidase accessory protein
VTLDTPGVTVVGTSPSESVVRGQGEGTVLTVNASDVTVRDVWVTDAGYSTTDNDAAVWVAGANATVDGVRVTNTTFGVWVDGASGATIRDSAIVGRESIARLSDRGNGIQLWEADGAVVANNTITDARDGIYFSWSTDVLARNNTMWDLRYGVHYMYSDHNRLANNTAFDNDVGYALMVSDDIDVVDNVAVNNSGTSGHGVLLKEVDHSRVARNDLVGNGNGLFVYNSMDNDVVDNLVLANDVGVHLTAGSTDARASGNSFVDNGDAMKAVLGEQVAWNGSDRGNYWDGARPVDVDHDGVSEVRFQATGVLDEMSHRQPEVEVFASSPAFDAVRLATRSVPLLETPGVVDHHPLARPAHDDWRRYYE